MLWISNKSVKPFMESWTMQSEDIIFGLFLDEDENLLLDINPNPLKIIPYLFKDAFYFPLQGQKK